MIWRLSSVSSTTRMRFVMSPSVPRMDNEIASLRSQ
jgi:hypothetical protein